MKIETAPESISLMLKPASSLCNCFCEYCFYRRVGECRISPFCMGDCTRFRSLSGNGKTSEYCAAIRRVYHHIEPHLPEIQKRVAAYRSEPAGV
jgi:sulfatase maturation enzyme AslB (radical SAM superfamily)